MDQATASLMAITTYSNMGQIPQLRTAYNREEAIAHLKKDPSENAIEISDGEAEVVIVVFCGAGAQENQYFFQVAPLEDPGDAEGGDLTAEEAVDAAVRALESGVM